MRELRRERSGVVRDFIKRLMCCFGRHSWQRELRPNREVFVVHVCVDCGKGKIIKTIVKGQP